MCTCWRGGGGGAGDANTRRQVQGSGCISFECEQGLPSAEHTSRRILEPVGVGFVQALLELLVRMN